MILLAVVELVEDVLVGRAGRLELGGRAEVALSLSEVNEALVGLFGLRRNDSQFVLENAFVPVRLRELHLHVEDLLSRSIQLLLAFCAVSLQLLAQLFAVLFTIALEGRHQLHVQTMHLRHQQLGQLNTLPQHSLCCLMPLQLFLESITLFLQTTFFLYLYF